MSIREVKSKKQKKELHIEFISIIKINMEDLSIIQRVALLKKQMHKIMKDLYILK